MSDNNDIDNGDIHPLDWLRAKLAAGSSQKAYDDSIASLPKSPEDTPLAASQVSVPVAGPGLFDLASSAYNKAQAAGNVAASPLIAAQKPADDNSDDDDSLVSAPQVSAGTALQTAPTANPVNPVLQAYLQNKQQMQAAQAQTNQNQLATGLAGALAQIGHGISRAPGSADLSVINEGGKNDDAPIKNLAAAQASGQQALASAKSLQDNDPNSAVSQATRKIYGPILAKSGMDPALIAGMSAQDVKDYAQNPLEFKSKQDATAALKAQTAAIRQDALQAKLSKDHENYLTHVEDKEAGWRSDPATMRADTNLAAVKTANDILSKYRGKEDEMPLQDIHALAAEKIRVMTGGGGNESDVVSQMPNSLATKWAGVKSFVTGNLQPANAGDYVRNMDKYFGDVERSSMASIQSRQKTIAGDPRLTPDESQRVQKIAVPQPVYPQQSGASKIKVSNGTESYMVDPKDLAHAAHDGFSPVQ